MGDIGTVRLGSYWAPGIHRIRIKHKTRVTALNDTSTPQGGVAQLSNGTAQVGTVRLLEFADDMCIHIQIVAALAGLKIAWRSKPADTNTAIDVNASALASEQRQIARSIISFNFQHAFVTLVKLRLKVTVGSVDCVI